MDDAGDSDQMAVPLDKTTDIVKHTNCFRSLHQTGVAQQR